MAPLAVLASATDGPDYGLDINLWADSPSDWGKVYGFGALRFGNPALYFSTQVLFPMGFFHEDRVICLAAPFIKGIFPLPRSHQYSSLLAMVGMPRMKNEMIVLLSNRHLALQKPESADL